MADEPLQVGNRGPAVSIKITKEQRLCLSVASEWER